MKSMLVSLLAFVFISISHAQIIIDKSFNRPGTYTVKKLYARDSLVILCDTVFLVNRPLFRVYSGLYSKQGNIQSLLKETSAFYENRIREQEIEYDKLNHEFPAMQEKFEIYHRHTQDQLDSLQQSVSKAEENLARARQESSKLQEQVDKALQRCNNQKYIFGVGGITAGVIIAFLLK